MFFLKKNNANIKTVKGFTLIEILIVSGLITTVGTIIVIVLFATIRAGKKAETLIILKQSGNALVSQVSKGIRFAKSLDSPAVCNSSTTLTSITVTSINDNAQTTYSCVGGTSPTIASNGASLIDTTNQAVSSCSFYCSQTTVNDPPVINLNFTLSTKTSSSVDTTGSVPFRTSVIMRNIAE